MAAPYEEESSHSTSAFQASFSDDSVDEIPPVVTDQVMADEKSAMNTMGNMEDPKIAGREPIIVYDVAPLRMVPMREEVPTPLRQKKPRTPRVWHEAPIPQWLKDRAPYDYEDWAVFYNIRDSDDRRDWIYSHKEYRRKFRSRGEVELFLDSRGNTNLFKGKKLQRRKIIEGSDGQEAGTRPTRGRKAANSATGTNNVLIDLNVSATPESGATGFPVASE
ncbi:hypothetical protein ACP70R_019762 [Stipagrostis hirtigluma subsp. patula]